MLCFVAEKLQKLQSGWGGAPDPDGGAYSAPPYPLAGREGLRPLLLPPPLLISSTLLLSRTPPPPPRLPTSLRACVWIIITSETLKIVSFTAYPFTWAVSKYFCANPQTLPSQTHACAITDLVMHAHAGTNKLAPVCQSALLYKYKGKGLYTC